MIDQKQQECSLCIWQRLGLTLLMLFLFSCGRLSVAQANELRHYTPYFPPYFEGTTDKVTGAYARLTKAIYKRAKLNIKIEIVPYARIYNFSLPEDVAVISYGENADTNHKLLYPIPRTSILLKIYSLKPNPPSELNALVDKRIAIKRGFPLGRFEDIRNGGRYRVIKANTVAQAIQLLLKKRVEYLVTMDDPYQKDSKTIEFGDKRVWSANIESMNGWNIAVVKDHPKAAELYQRIKLAYEALVAEGVIVYDNHRMFLSTDI